MKHFVLLFSLAGLTLAADKAPDPEKALTTTQQEALKSTVQKISEAQALQNAIVAEICKTNLGIPEDKLSECMITKDLSKAVWVKSVPPALPTATPPGATTSPAAKPKAEVH
jgi:hypothetical protein